MLLEPTAGVGGELLEISERCVESKSGDPGWYAGGTLVVTVGWLVA